MALSVMLISCYAQKGDRLFNEKTEGNSVQKENNMVESMEKTIASESGNSADENQIEEECLIDQAMSNNMHNIYDGYIENTEIRMKISRQDDFLSAAFITRADEECTFEGKILNATEFELQNSNGDFMRGVVEEQNEYIILSGTGEISRHTIKFSMERDTYIPIGWDFANYYSGNLGAIGNAEEVEAFARKIKGSINNKEEFIKLFKYPITIYINGKPILIQDEEDMGPQYDWLISEDTFREVIENMFTKYLFKNYLGVCVEDGVIWFDDNKITALSFYSTC